MRQPYVVRVHVRYDDAQHWQAFEFVGKNGFPLCLGFFLVDAAVHDAPALLAVDFVAQQPEVDVVECKRQCHADPLDARRDCDALAQLGQGVTHRVMQLLFQIVHGAFLLHN